MKNKKINKSRWSRSFYDGISAEKHFMKLLLDKGVNAKKSTTQQDINDHIDIFIDDIGIDVKGNRHLECIWLEIQNVRGEDGWLKGKAKYIVFDIKELNAFCFYRRLDLLDYVSQFKETTLSKNDYLKWYTREKWGRKDKIIKVRHEDIKHLEVKQLSYATIKT